jgi:DNA-directed RNA polymerase subunit RPC12/RpoP
MTRPSRLDMRVDGARLVLTGRIDDSAQLEPLAAKLPAGAVTIDTSAITFVNSVGMREWLRLVRVLRERGTVTLERVGDVLMTQMNLIPEFGSSVQISSFHAQYVCSSCGHESAPLVDVATHAPTLQTMKAPRLPCPECGAPMDLGDFPERYLSIFRNR